jgi:hypothetical protein
MQYLPNSPINDMNVEQVIDTFMIVLEDLPAETILAAARQYLSTETFFPTPGKLRELAMDLQMLSMGVPTPGEAWGMVLTARRYVGSKWCAVGVELRDQAISTRSAYPKEYYEHMDSCDFCTASGGFKDVYSNGVVEATVRLLGGRDVILTDNPVADRARFIEAYREVVARERTKAAMLPDVQEYVIEQSRKSDVQLGVGKLTKRLGVK